MDSVQEKLLQDDSLEEGAMDFTFGNNFSTGEATLTIFHMQRSDKPFYCNFDIKPNGMIDEHPKCGNKGFSPVLIKLLLVSYIIKQFFF